MIVKKRFWLKVKKTSSCWIWIGQVNWFGYGIIKINKKIKKAHRISWKLHNGKIPKGLCVLHKCDNPPCVNPKHLFLGTLADNNKDRVKKGRSIHIKGENMWSAKLKKAQIIQIRKFYKSGSYLQKELAKIFNVSKQNIQCIVNNKSWKHI